MEIINLSNLHSTQYKAILLEPSKNTFILRIGTHGEGYHKEIARNFGLQEGYNDEQLHLLLSTSTARSPTNIVRGGCWVDVDIEKKTMRLYGYSTDYGWLDFNLAKKLIEDSSDFKVTIPS